MRWESRVKKFNIMEVHWKTPFLWGAFTGKPYGGLLEKKGLERFADLRGVLVKRRGWYFWGGGDFPMHTMDFTNTKIVVAFMSAIWKVPLKKFSCIRELEHQRPGVHEEYGNKGRRGKANNYVARVTSACRVWKILCIVKKEEVAGVVHATVFNGKPKWRSLM